MRQFKARKIIKRKKHVKLKIFIFTLFFFFSYVFCFKKLNYYKKDKNMLNENINYINLNIKKIISRKVEESINNPILFLEDNIKLKKEKVENVNMVVEEEKKQQEEVIIENKPLVYIYNTHQTETYFDYSVYDAASLLSEKLNNNGIKSLFEEKSIPVFMQDNNLKYSKSYTVSRKYLNEAKDKYNSLNYFFDIHRDALSKNKSTINIDGKNYAKILLLVGLENPNYERNLINAEKLNEIINKKINGISRGIMKKEGENVNGIYNQDVSDNVFLIEIGGNHNNKEEVINTVNVLTECIIEYIRGVV